MLVEKMKSNCMLLAKDHIDRARQETLVAREETRMQTMCADNEQGETQRLTVECSRHAGIIVDAQRTVTQ